PISEAPAAALSAWGAGAAGAGCTTILLVRVSGVPGGGSTLSASPGWILMAERSSPTVRAFVTTTWAFPFATTVTALTGPSVRPSRSKAVVLGRSLGTPSAPVPATAQTPAFLRAFEEDSTFFPQPSTPAAAFAGSRNRTG